MLKKSELIFGENKKLLNNTKKKLLIRSFKLKNGRINSLFKCKEAMPNIKSEFSDEYWQVDFS